MADGSVKIEITADDSDIKKKLDGVEDSADEAADGLNKLGDSADDAGDGFNAADVAIGTFVGNALTDLVNKTAEAISSIASLADETREYREDMAKLDSAFTTAGHSTETAQKAYDNFYKLLGESDRTVEAVNHLAELTNSEKELEQWTTICAGVTAKFGDSLPIEGLTEAANETAKVGQVTGPLADALNWAGISEDEFNKKLEACNSEQERAALITETLNGEYAAAAEEYNKLTANTQAARDATNNMEQAQAALGAAIEPVTTAWTNMKAQALQWLVEVGLPALQAGWQWVIDNLPAVLLILGGLATAWLAAGGAQTIATAATAAYTKAQTALNASFLASPIFWVIAGITALVAGFMILWDNCEGFRNFWIGLWKIIQDSAKAVADWFVSAFNSVVDFFVGFGTSVGKVFTDLWSGITGIFSAVASWFNNTVIQPIVGFFTGMWTGLIDGAKNAWSGIQSVFSAVASFFSSIFTAAWSGVKAVFSTGGKIFDGIKDGIVTAFKTVVNAIIKGINKVVALPFEGLNGILDRIHGISIVGVKPFKWLTWRAPVPQLPMLAKGGVVDKATLAMIGENGKEAVVPLEHNTGWIKEIADKISQSLNFGGAVLDIELDDNNGISVLDSMSNHIDKVASLKKAMAEDMQELTSRVKAVVTAENARMAQGVGVRDYGISEVAQAVGMQTAGINSLASEYRNGASRTVEIPLVLNDRELGRAIVDLGTTETNRTGPSLSFA